MKNRVLTFIIGVLTGAIIATIGFLIYSKNLNKNMKNNRTMMPMQQNQQMQSPSGEMQNPPEKPDVENFGQNPM